MIYFVLFFEYDLFGHLPWNRIWAECWKSSFWIWYNFSTKTKEIECNDFFLIKVVKYFNKENTWYNFPFMYNRVLGTWTITNGNKVKKATRKPIKLANVNLYGIKNNNKRNFTIYTKLFETLNSQQQVHWCITLNYSSVSMVKFYFTKV